MAARAAASTRAGVEVGASRKISASPWRAATAPSSPASSGRRSGMMKASTPASAASAAKASKPAASSGLR